MVSAGITPDWHNAAGDDDVYAAEEAFAERLADDLDHDDPDAHLDPADVPGFMVDTLNRSDWGVSDWSLDDLPEVRFDVPDDSDLAGVHGGASTGAIHLHPKLARPTVVLHELAHWLRPHDGHEDPFRSTFVGLIEVALGDWAADLLREAYAERGLSHDW